MEMFLFWFCGVAMVLGGLMTVFQRNTVVSAVWLIFAFVSAAGIYALLQAPFVAVLQVLVYAGAIMVLFLFVIMMLQGDTLPAEGLARRLVGRLALALPPAALALIALSWLAKGRAEPFAAAPPEGFGSVAGVAGLLLNRYLLAFELISVILLVAIVGAVALARKERSLPWQ